MFDVSVVTDLDECQEIWNRSMPRELISDLWGFRACFQRNFRRPACFLVAEQHRGLAGLLPLSWIQETGCYGYFPGETWRGKTWLEQNRIWGAGGEIRAPEARKGLRRAEGFPSRPELESSRVLSR